MDFVLGDQVEVGAFREKLSQNFVSVFDRSLLLAVIGVAEKALAIQYAIREFVICIFSSIVISHCF